MRTGPVSPGPGALAARTAAMVVDGGVAPTSRLIAPTAGRLTVATTPITASGAWCTWVGARSSPAEACVGRDVPLGPAVLVTALG